MFLLMGINDKIKDLGRVEHSECPVCGQTGALFVCTKYMTPHIFFIPMFRFARTYFATCGKCASVMGLDEDKGRSIERGDFVHIQRDDLTVMHNNARSACPRCGHRAQPGAVFCSDCGERL